MISAEQRCAFRDIELRQEAEPVEPNNDVADATQEMATCDSKREREVGIDKVNGTKGEAEMRRGNEGSWVWWWSYRFL